MVDNILTLLEIAKEKQIKGVHIDIALGRYKYPETIREAYQKLKQWDYTKK